MDLYTYVLLYKEETEGVDQGRVWVEKGKLLKPYRYIVYIYLKRAALLLVYFILYKI